MAADDGVDVPKIETDKFAIAAYRPICGGILRISPYAIGRYDFRCLGDGEKPRLNDGEQKLG